MSLCCFEEIQEDSFYLRNQEISIITISYHLSECCLSPSQPICEISKSIILLLPALKNPKEVGGGGFDVIFQSRYTQPILRHFSLTIFADFWDLGG